jgi:outer membrane immunogenic protein
LPGWPKRLEYDEAPRAAFSWTGFDLGAHAGYAWGSVDQRQTTGGMPVGPFSYDVDGAFAGGTAGYNWQAGQLVVGIEGDLGWMDLSGAGRIPSSNPAAHQDITLDAGLYGDITGRWASPWGEPCSTVRALGLV